MKTLKEFKKDFEKITVKKSLGGNDLKWKLNKPLDEVIQTLREIRNKHDNEYNNLRLEVDGENDYNGGCYIWAYIYGDRLETQEEFNKRVDLEYTRYQNQWDSDRAKYKYLKKKFEG
jgi:hypothetical protein